MLHGLHNILSYIFFLYFHDILYIFSLLALSARRLLEYPWKRQRRKRSKIVHPNFNFLGTAILFICVRKHHARRLGEVEPSFLVCSRTTREDPQNALGAASASGLSYALTLTLLVEKISCLNIQSKTNILTPRTPLRFFGNLNIVAFSKIMICLDVLQLSTCICKHQVSRLWRDDPSFFVFGAGCGSQLRPTHSTSNRFLGHQRSWSSPNIRRSNKTVQFAQHPGELP